jgi:predicted nucleic acid-binding protein
MSASRGLILDANILIRAVFGVRVREILEKSEDEAKFYTPDACFQDAQKYVPIVPKGRRFDIDLGLSVLDQVGHVVERVDRSLYEEYEAVARERIGARDPDDWPVVATALLLDRLSVIQANCGHWIPPQTKWASHGGGVATGCEVSGNGWNTARPMPLGRHSGSTL